MSIDFPILAFIAVWFIFSILAQLNTPGIHRFDYFKVLPTYKFFSPRPVSKDFCIYIRGVTDDCKDNWTPLFYNKKQWWCFIWNPQLRLSKALNDLFDQLESFRNSADLLHISIPYLILLNSANAQIVLANNQCTHVQFMIGCYEGYNDTRITIIFLSNIHVLEIL